jgi:hypothetical protein
MTDLDVIKAMLDIQAKDGDGILVIAEVRYTCVRCGWNLLLLDPSSVIHISKHLDGCH